MKKVKPLLISISFMCCMLGSPALSLNWQPKSNFIPGNRYGAFSFAIGQKGYVGSGLVQTGTSVNLINDMWEYNKALDQWTQVASLPGNGRISAGTFVALNKGYVTTGYDMVVYLNDNWQYDPILNSWQLKTSFPGDPRYTCTSFDVSDYGFVGMGKSGGYYSDFYRYNPISDTWISITTIPGTLRQSAKGFSINDYGYVLGGANEGTGYNGKELWRYDPIGDVWDQKTDYPGNGSHGLAAFVINGEGYIGTGTTLPGNLNIVFEDFYSYNPGNDSWTLIQDFGGGIRQGSVSMTIGNSGFVGMGSTVIYPLLDYRSDWWTFDNPTGIEVHGGINSEVTAFFNISHNLMLQFTKPVTVKTKVDIFNSTGQLLASDEINVNQQEIEIKNLKPISGIYYYTLSGSTINLTSGKVMFLK